MRKPLYHIQADALKTHIIRVRDSKVLKTFRAGAETQTIVNYLNTLPGIKGLYDNYKVKEYKDTSPYGR